jgi:hypothetical protein
VGPFNPRPWSKKCTDAPAPAKLPDGFVTVYGVAPVASDFGNYQNFQIARDKYAQDLKYFKRIGAPEGIDQERLAAAATFIASYGIGEPIVFEGRYGFMSRFVGMKLRDFEVPFVTLYTDPDGVITDYQMALAHAGTPVSFAECHPFTIPRLCGSEGN